MFIDPPYNTGSAFTHYDDGVEHSLWLSLMRDRLEAIRTLLAEDGSYELDFVVECVNHYLLIKPKRADQISSDEVKLKARAANRWYGYANEHAKNHGNKLWFYLLIPHDAIVLGRSLNNLKAEYSGKIEKV